MYSEIHPRKVRDLSLESQTFIPALSEFSRRSLKRRDNLRKRKMDDGRGKKEDAYSILRTEGIL